VSEHRRVLAQPEFPDDDGTASPAVASALASYDADPDAGHRPEAVPHERGRSEQEHDVEAADERGDVDRVAAERQTLATGVDDHQSVLTRVWSPPATPKNFSKTRSAAGAAAVEPWPPFSITAHTTIRGASVSAGP